MILYYNLHKITYEINFESKRKIQIKVLIKYKTFQVQK
jgi:hypothetical protein